MPTSDNNRILKQLLEKASIAASIESCQNVTNSGLTNRTAVVSLEDGSKYVLRQYSWPHKSPDDLDRLRKEVYLHELLSRKGVPVPRVVAELKEKEQGAVLLEYLSGELLGDVAVSLGSEKVSQTHGSRVEPSFGGSIASDFPRERPGSLQETR